MKNKLLYSASLAACVILFSACNSRSGWSVEGNIAGIPGQKIALQAFNNKNWYTIDSISVADNGSFEYHSATPAAFPDVFRLSYNGKNIFFPVDSINKITITADAADFANSYKLSGSESAIRFAKVDSLISSTIKTKGEVAAATDSLLKRQLTEIALRDNNQITAYYIINKRLAGRPLFDPAVSRDRAVIGAVAQNFVTNRPDDPRAASLRNIFINAKIAADPQTADQPTVEVPETGLPADIISFDNNGKRQSIYETAAKGNVVLLSFTNYTLESSPAYNVILADLYSKHKDQGLEIFQIAFGSDEAQWRQSAVNLPWITVWNSPEDGTATMINYNVNVLPLTYIIDRHGDLRARVTDPTTLPSEIAKYL